MLQRKEKKMVLLGFLFFALVVIVAPCILLMGAMGSYEMVD